MLLVSTESGTETAMLMDILRQNGILHWRRENRPAKHWRRIWVLPLTATIFFVDEADIEKATEIIHSLERNIQTESFQILL